MEEKKVIIDNVSKEFLIGYNRNLSATERFISLFSGREPKKIIDVLKRVSLDIYSGEVVGIIGDNGSGKSTLLRIIAGIYKPDVGSVTVNGKIISLINLYIGLKDRLEMRDNIYLCCSLFGLTRREINERFDSIVTFSELSKFVNTKIYQFSEGMKQRFVFSIAMHCNPEILLLDEIFEVGDENFREKSVKKIQEIVQIGGCVVLVSHDMEMINKYCNRVGLMDAGHLIGVGKPNEIIEKYLKHFKPDTI
jgi:ABC-type polysaccharide/polyol phosphate transport system ATPase subunit